MPAESWAAAGVAAFDAAAPAGPLTLHGQATVGAALELRQIEPSNTGAARWVVGTLTLVERPGGLWAVRDLTTPSPVRYLSRTGHWSTDGGAGPEWEVAYWHDFDTAVRLAQADQPEVAP